MMPSIRNVRVLLIAAGGVLLILGVLGFYFLDPVHFLNRLASGAAFVAGGLLIISGARKKPKPQPPPE